MKGSGPQRHRGPAPFKKERKYSGPENTTPAKRDKFPLGLREAGNGQEPSEVDMRRLAQDVWRESFFRKLHFHMKDKIGLVSHPHILAKALYFLSSNLRELLRHWERSNRELAGVFNIKPAAIGTARNRILQSIARKITDIRVFALSFDEVVAVGLEEANRPKRNAIGGWQKIFLETELGIKGPVSEEDWEEAFETLSGSEKEIVFFCSAQGKNFSDFSRKKYGTPAWVSVTYKKAKRKLAQRFPGVR